MVFFLPIALQSEAYINISLYLFINFPFLVRLKMQECSIKRGKSKNVTNSGRIKRLEHLLKFVVIVMMFVPRGRRSFNRGLARDVMAAMLWIKNKIISLLLDTNGPLVTWLQTKNCRINHQALARLREVLLKAHGGTDYSSFITHKEYS